MRFRIHATPLFASSLFAAAGTGTAMAQCENSFTFTLPDASGVQYVDDSMSPASGTYDPVAIGSMSFTPDRRPGFWVNFYGNARFCETDPAESNPLALSEIWRESVWDQASPWGVKQWLDSFVDGGFRRMLINRPGGNAADQYVPQAHYHHLPAARKSMINNDLAGWIEDQIDEVDSNFDFGVFIGSWQGGHPATPCLRATSGGIYWDCDDDDNDLGFTYTDIPVNPRGQASMQETYQNFYPWLSAGCSFLALDNSASGDPSGYALRDRTLELIQSPDYTGIRFIGEAVPNDGTDIYTTYAEAMPWLCFYTGFAKPKGWGLGGANGQTLDPATTEVIVVFDNPFRSGSEYSLAEMAYMRDSGFVVWGSHSNDVPYIQRLYDGDSNEFYDNLTNAQIADFNGDGTIDCDDYDLFVANWINSFVYGSDHTAVWDGDVDGDGDIDMDDVSFFAGLDTWPCS